MVRISALFRLASDYKLLITENGMMKHSGHVWDGQLWGYGLCSEWCITVYCSVILCMANQPLQAILLVCTLHQIFERNLFFVLHEIYITGSMVVPIMKAIYP